ncbi:[Fe-Fe] hydrogenase large subunit C-terminal domain-containing protein [Acetanaerobacterium elongatum]|uniref:Iron only hydrogenase large subunit, C-terminal domain n=1 Tax=Acetanaerobacterium elongatum TaxID=258515 RepID=A0A1G9U7C4_9FIRM|nr:[Fe-Fe] hydrogenase large subunit C-terminal domain-containing protein [Acetanaerobacterium elongatum]SDM55877.1 Iron only hydrogenase large subunit, C-terminal domain [Acetanaerobacterium elongatum]
MGSIIELNTANCKNCYRCIRECPAKAIRFKNDRASIIESECIECGVCVEVCPQTTRRLKNETEAVKSLLSEGKPVYISVAPSWVSWYEGVSFAQLSAALKGLGFAGVEETAIGACESSREYTRLIETGGMKNIIVTACTSVVMLIERHYPELLGMLAPVSSPMMAHARMMRETYGDIRVVFVGPCISKMNETTDALAGGLVNHAITFANLDDWLHKAQIGFSQEDNEAVGVTNPIARLYPKAGGILATIPVDTGSYTRIAVDGLYRCIELFNAIRDEGREGLFIEANLCPGGCVGGPVFSIAGKNPLFTQLRISGKPMPQDARPAPDTAASLTHPRVFMNRSPKHTAPTDEDIRRILARIGKYSAEQELNCGGCGYKTCREKAEAVFYGKADINMCLPYFRERAENMSNIVLEHSPNAIIVLDKTLQVQELNPKAEEVLCLHRTEVIGSPVPLFYGDLAFEQAKAEKTVSKKLAVQEVSKTFEQTITYIAEHQSYIVLLKDITKEEQRKQDLEVTRSRTVDIAQEVINKQMRVAQEIASLLGETTAETKVALTNLKKSMATLTEENRQP